MMVNVLGHMASEPPLSLAAGVRFISLTVGAKMSKALGANSKEEIAYALMRSVIAADENYQDELKLYSESLGATGVGPTIGKLLEAAPIK